jgi:uncharacterized protein (DUF488 family)
MPDKGNLRRDRTDTQVVEIQHPVAGPRGMLYTIGHSNRSLDDFLNLLHSADIRLLIDVRSHPSSRRFPIYNRNALTLALEDEGIAYTWLGRQLGGMRRGKPDSPHTALASDGFRGYADHMAGEQFRDGIEQLTALARHQTTAIMCAERDPYQCHRSMIADFLLLRDWHVTHLIERNIRQDHRFSPLARSQDRLPIYDRLDQEQLDLSF